MSTAATTLIRARIYASAGFTHAQDFCRLLAVRLIAGAY